MNFPARLTHLRKEQRFAGAVSQLPEGEQAVVRQVLEGLIVKYQTCR